MEIKLEVESLQTLYDDNGHPVVALSFHPVLMRASQGKEFLGLLDNRHSVKMKEVKESGK